MFANKKVSFLLLKFCFVAVCSANVDYFNPASRSYEDELDPHSFYYDKHSQTEFQPTGNNDNHDIGDFKGGDASTCYKLLHKCKMGKTTDVADELLSRRIINMLVSRAKFKKDDGYFTGIINMEGTASELEALQNFGLGKLTLREVDAILNKVVQIPQFDVVFESVVWIHNIANILWNYILMIFEELLWHKEIVAGVVGVLFLAYFLRGTQFNFWIVMTVVVSLILISSFFITWWKLIQEARIKHTVLQMKNMELPVQCQLGKMSWMDKVRAFFVTDDCEKYYEAMMSEPLLQVTPVQALSHMLAKTAFEPLELIGKTLASFLSNLTQNMPWWLSAVVYSAFCLGFFPALILFVTLLIGGSLNFGFGPFSMISLRGPQGSSAPRQSESLESKKERQPIEVMLNDTDNVRRMPKVTKKEKKSTPKVQRRKTEKTSPQIAAIDYVASGDRESTNCSGSSKDSDCVRERKIEEMGSGDHV